MKLSTPALGLLLLGPLAGCQDQPRPTVWTGDNKAVSEVVDDWKDVDESNNVAATALFAKDAQPTAAQLKALRGYNVMHNGPPKIAGESATMPVLLYPRKAKAEPTPIDWSFQKEGEAWKIKAAPLP